VIDASVLVVGGGAIGGVTAAHLTGAVRRVAVLDADADHVERLQGGGAAPRRARGGAPRVIDGAVVDRAAGTGSRRRCTRASSS
jgi:2-dehydropantoate 2-reductase